MAQYIKENNRDENIHIFSIFEYKDIYDIEWDDYLIDLDCIKILIVVFLGYMRSLNT